MIRSKYTCRHTLIASYKLIVKEERIGVCKTPGTSSLFDVDVESDILSDTNRKHYHSAVTQLLYS